MRLFLILALLIVSMPAMAQDGDEATRRELAVKMHEIWPTRLKIEAALDAVVENVPEENRASLKSQLRQAINYEALEEESITAMVQTFTEEELEKMVAFYSSKEGRSISAKIDDYQQALSPAMTRMLDKAMLDTKLGRTGAP